MVKQQYILEVKRNDRVYQLQMACDSPLGEIFDALCEMQSYIVQSINNSQKKPEPPKEQSPEQVG